jgi:hypothetical protein
MAIDPAAGHELFTDEHDIVGTYLRELAERGADIARALVPRDTGHMMETITSGVSHDRSGTLQGWFGAGYLDDPPFGTPYQGGFPVLNALEARSGRVRNRRAPYGRFTWRDTHPFLTRSQDILAGEV